MRIESPEVRAALLAARFARQLGLPPGNLWEPACARRLHARWLACRSWNTIEAEAAASLGLQGEDACA